jgi:hypothetical protein
MQTPSFSHKLKRKAPTTGRRQSKRHIARPGVGAFYDQSENINHVLRRNRKRNKRADAYSTG